MAGFCGRSDYISRGSDEQNDYTTKSASFFLKTWCCVVDASSSDKSILAISLSSLQVLLVSIESLRKLVFVKRIHSRAPAGPKGRQVEPHNYRGRITCMHRNRNPCNSFLIVKMASGMDHRRMGPRTTTTNDVVQHGGHQASIKFSSLGLQCISLMLCGSRKYPYPPHGWSMEIPRGWGVKR